MSSYFEGISKIAYEGTNSENPLAFRWYNKDQKVFGKRMEDVLRFAVCYWHTFCWEGGDPFGGETFLRPWNAISDVKQQALAKADAAFDFFSKLGAPYYCFHDRDVIGEGKTPQESKKLLWEMSDVLAKKQEETGVKLLWGTANAFSARRYMAGASTNPNFEVFAFAAAQIREVMEVTKKLGGENYVLWGGREGYEMLSNTDLKREADQLGRLLALVVEHKHKIGFKGTILIEPKPREPSKHQYDFDVQTVYGFLKSYGLEKEIKVNIEANHATLAGHAFEHELAMASALGILGSVDMNRGDAQCGWDTDQFPNSIPEIAMAYYYIMQNGGLGTGGTNFDAKVRRQSIDPVDLFYGHIGGMDVCARGLLIAEKMIADGKLSKIVADRYASWNTPLAKDTLAGKVSLEDLSKYVLEKNIDPAPISGRQEYIENLLNRYI
ncbi:xylose isomerase [Uliginosibacterium gangwonense]|uniref:xylose isomerase n=1 Tax=Uliginosibacterium gangwonense TaxID=392736 RepID=UPI00036B317F|nr:xylose isomerase [Uliginosibacterium gangwonense]